MVTLAQALAAKTEFSVVRRTNGVAEVTVTSTKTGKAVHPKLGAAMLHAAGVRGAVQNTEKTFVVADAAFARAEQEAFERKYKYVVDRIKTRLYNPDADGDTFPTAYIVGVKIYVSNGTVTEPLTGPEAEAYLSWLIDTGKRWMPSAWRESR